MATSYSNPGGSGDRSTSILTLTTLSLSGGSPSIWLNGSYDHGPYFPSAYANAGLWLQFDFQFTVLIDELKIYQSGAASHGYWVFQGSMDGVNWISLTGNYEWISATQTIPCTLTCHAFRYYRILGVSGNVNFNPWVNEIEFKTEVMPSSKQYLFLNRDRLRITGVSLSVVSQF
jgi:hypothetical protein